MTYKQIGEAMGISRQRVSQICGKQDVAHFRVITDCPYHNLRNWMNENKVSRTEFIRRMGLESNRENLARFRKIIRGENEPRKSYIDKMLKVTGFTYEQLFEVIPGEQIPKQESD